jgi:hypothetical protein
MLLKKEENKNFFKRKIRKLEYLFSKKDFKNSLLVFDKERYEKALEKTKAESNN